MSAEDYRFIIIGFFWLVALLGGLLIAVLIIAWINVRSLAESLKDQMADHLRKDVHRYSEMYAKAQAKLDKIDAAFDDDE